MVGDRQKASQTKRIPVQLERKREEPVKDLPSGITKGRNPDWESDAREK